MQQQFLTSNGDPNAAAVATQVQRERLQTTLDNLIKQRLEFQVEIAQRPAGDRMSEEMRKQLPVLEEQIKLAQFEVDRLDRQTNEQASTTASATPTPSLPAMPDEYVLLGGLLIVVTLLPISIAFARRVWRQRPPERITLGPALDQRLSAMQTSIDAVALEVERVGEGQRFVTGLLNSQLGGAAQDTRQQMPEAVPKRELHRAVTPH